MVDTTAANAGVLLVMQGDVAAVDTATGDTQMTASFAIADRVVASDNSGQGVNVTLSIPPVIRPN